MLSETRKLRLAQSALALQQWQSNAIPGIGRNRDERRLMPPLIFGLYLAHRGRKKTSKGEASKLMGVDKSATAPKYFAYLVDCGVIEIEVRPPEDRRKDFVMPTPRLLELVEAQLLRAAEFMIAITRPVARKRRRADPLHEKSVNA